MSTTNRFGAACANADCATYLPPRTGIVTRTSMGTRADTWVTCAPGTGEDTASHRSDTDREGPTPAA
ncbi:hypothetical protein [Embleya scabrispora]|uniref:hypothetical protein n=1 Tax=Embleya scabrispora TaxID=159449 RepID=UPI000C7DA6BD|nr:hypothetical protein [Embleya scabrispora]